MYQVEALSSSFIKVLRGACGAAHTIFLTEDGALFGCGLNDSGQVGCGYVDGPSSKATPSDLSILDRSLEEGSPETPSATIELTKNVSGPCPSAISKHKKLACNLFSMSKF